MYLDRPSQRDVTWCESGSPLYNITCARIVEYGDRDVRSHWLTQLIKLPWIVLCVLLKVLYYLSILLCNQLPTANFHLKFLNSVKTLANIVQSIAKQVAIFCVWLKQLIVHTCLLLVVWHTWPPGGSQYIMDTLAYPVHKPGAKKCLVLNKTFLFSRSLMFCCSGELIQSIFFLCSCFFRISSSSFSLLTCSIFSSFSCTWQ